MTKNSCPKCKKSKNVLEILVSKPFRATVETEYFEVFGDLLSVFIVILPSVKNGSTKRAWRRNNWTVREEGFRSCHCLRSFSKHAECAVWRGWIVAQNQRHFAALLTKCCNCYRSANFSGDQRAAWCVSEEHCYRSVFASLAFACNGWLISRRSKPAFPAIVFINEVSLLTPIGLALNQHLLESLLWFMPR